MAGNLRLIDGAGDSPHAQMLGPAKRRGSSAEGTPLRRFASTKASLAALLSDGTGFFHSLKQRFTETSKEHPKLAGKDAVEAVSELADALDAVQILLKRDHMKAVVFGRTSNGKSTVINALLHDKVLPQGMGHTTRCFIKVKASSSGEHYLKVKGSDVKLGVNSIDEMAHALCDTHKPLGENTLVKLYLPARSSTLLQNDVALMDSPGVDVAPHVDEWIDSHCRDADVFILVTNAEATLTQSEKTCFRQISKQVPGRPIFILNNRWDASSEENASIRDKVRAQHMSQFEQFLVDELRVCTAEQASERIFFVSAREVLGQRLRARSQDSPSIYLAEGHLNRTQEFHEFEKCFEASISETAIQNKMHHCAERARHILDGTTEQLDGTIELAEDECKRLAATQLEMVARRQQMDASLRQLVAAVEADAAALRAEVELKVADDFADEIDRLDRLVERFDMHFADQVDVVQRYNIELAKFVQISLNNNLTAMCSGALLQRITDVKNDLMVSVKGLLPAESASKVDTVVLHNRPFGFAVEIPVAHLMENFREDLSFRYSLGIHSLLNWFVKVHRPSAQSLAVDSDTVVTADLSAYSVSPLAKLLFASDGSLLFMGIFAGGYLAWRHVNWMVLVMAAGAWGGLYCIERWRWDASAMEQRLREQMLDHLRLQLGTVARTHVASCVQQVHRELGDTTARMKNIGVGALQQLKGDVDANAQHRAAVDAVVKQLVGHRQQCDSLRERISHDVSSPSPATGAASRALFQSQS